MSILQNLWVAVVLLTTVVIAEAQQQKKVFRIGYFSNANPVSDATRIEVIRKRLAELGHIEGQNIAVEYRYGDGKRERAPDLVAELLRLKVELIVVLGGGEAWIRPVMNATKTIPIVIFGGGLDPVGAGLIESLARPGGNLTGVTNVSGELGGKRLELLKEAVRKLIRVAVLTDPGNVADTHELKKELPPAARSLKLAIEPWEIRETADIEKVFTAVKKPRPDGLYVPGGSLIRANRDLILDFALKTRLPSVHTNKEYVENGGFMSYGADVLAQYRQVAWYIDKILTGARPAELPVQQPMKFEFAINLKTAKQIGITVPQSVLFRADRVIK